MSPLREALASTRKEQRAAAHYLSTAAYKGTSLDVREFVAAMGLAHATAALAAAAAGLLEYLAGETEPEPADVAGLARSAYGAYGQSTGGLNFQGDRMPPWDALPATTRQAWEAAISEVLK